LENPKVDGVKNSKSPSEEKRSSEKTQKRVARRMPKGQVKTKTVHKNQKMMVQKVARGLE
jgi:hypothetical protein